MKIFFTILNGVYASLLFAYLVKITISIFQNGIAPTGLIAPSILFILFSVNVYGCWRYPGLIISIIQIILNGILGPIIWIALRFVLPFLEKLPIKPTYAFGSGSLSDVMYIPYFITATLGAMCVYIAYNIYLNRSSAKKSKDS